MNPGSATSATESTSQETTMNAIVRQILILAGVAFFASSRASRAADNLESLREPAVFASAGDGTRSYLCTARGDLPKENFQAEVTVTIKGGGGNGCAFFGLGKGVPDPGNYNEPTASPSLSLRMCPSDFAGGMVSAAANGQGLGDGSTPVGDGTHRIRLTWDATGKRALFEISKNWDGHAFSRRLRGHRGCGLDRFRRRSPCFCRRGQWRYLLRFLDQARDRRRNQEAPASAKAF